MKKNNLPRAGTQWVRQGESQHLKTGTVMTVIKTFVSVPTFYSSNKKSAYFVQFHNGDTCSVGFFYDNFERIRL